MQNLLQIARSAVNQAIQSIRQQANVVQDQATAPIRAWVQKVLGGIWKGDGANRFVLVMTDEVIKELEVTTLTLNNFGGVVSLVDDIFALASNDATKQVSGLYDIFQTIVNF